MMLWEGESYPRHVRLLEEEEEVDQGEAPNIPWRYPSGGREGSGAGVGIGRSGAASLAGLAWFIWIVRQADPSSYTT